MEDVWPRLETIFQDVFDDETIKIGPNSTAQDVPGWDSLSTINLVVAVESEFRIKFALGEIQELKNVGEMANLIQRKLAKGK